jgi:hypothetical protein
MIFLPLFLKKVVIPAELFDFREFWGEKKAASNN